MPEKGLRAALVRSVVLTAPGSIRGWLFLRKRRRNTGKCDNLSFLRVCLSQMDSVLGGRNGLIPLLERGWPGPSRALLFEPQQCVILQASFFRQCA